MDLKSDTILLAASQPIVRNGLRGILGACHSHYRFKVVATVEELFEALEKKPQPALLLLDLALPVLPMQEILPKLRQIAPAMCLVLLTDPAMPLSPAITDVPFCCLISKQAPPEVFSRTIRLALGSHHSYSPPANASWTYTSTALTARETEVLKLAVQDLCNEEIADRLCLSVSTIEAHRRAMLQKTGTRTLCSLVYMAVQNGWLAG